MHSISHNPLVDNLLRVREQIDAAARACGRAPDTVQLIAVSKTRPAGCIREAAAAGCRDFGENYLQEALPKIAELGDLGLVWHFIGAIQTNKTREIAAAFDWVHTVSREKVARRLAGHCPAHKTLNVCLQVNIDRDPVKAGVAPEDTAALLDVLRGLPRLRVRGLMTVLDPERVPADGYRRLAALFHELATQAPECWDTLSMGMSGDFPAAIAAGATQVRIGTGIFGPRPAPGRPRTSAVH